MCQYDECEATTTSIFLVACRLWVPFTGNYKRKNPFHYISPIKRQQGKKQQIQYRMWIKTQMNANYLSFWGSATIGSSNIKWKIIGRTKTNNRNIVTIANTNEILESSQARARALHTLFHVATIWRKTESAIEHAYFIVSFHGYFTAIEMLALLIFSGNLIVHM